MAERCIACELPMTDGEPFYDDFSGGVIHARCTGDRENFVTAEGRPLGPDERLPTAMVWREKE